MNGDISILILAAGGSQRLGRPKQLLPFGKTSLIRDRVLVALQVEGSAVYVVLGAGAEGIREELDGLDCRTIIFSDWALGMGRTLSYAVSWMMERETPCSLLILTCDQALVSAKHCQEMIEAYNNSDKGIVATAYENIVGIPCLIDSKYFVEMRDLNQDVGAKKILSKYSQDVLSIPFELAKYDIDTEEDYNQVLQIRGELDKIS